MQRFRYVGAAVGVTCALLLALWVAPLITSGVSSTIRVGVGAPTYNSNTGAALQAAINAANPGDTILVRDGTFAITQTITVTKSLIIRGGYNAQFTNRISGFTTLEGTDAVEHNQSVVFIGSQTIAGCPPTLADLNEESFLPPVSPTALAVTLDGFRVQDGDNGVRICAPAEAQIDLIGLTVTENYTSTFTVAAPFTPTLPGGGIFAYLDNRATLVISGTNINSNRATEGGGIYVANSLGYTTPLGLIDDRMSPRLILNDVTFYQNAAATGGAAMITLDNFADIQLENVDIDSNGAYTTAGGLLLDTAMHSMLKMRNVSFERNQSLYGSGAGEIYLADNVAADMENTILQENSSTWGMSGLAIDTENNVQITGDKIVATGNTGSGPAFLSELANGASLTLSDGITLTNNTATNYGGGFWNDYQGSAGAWFEGENNAQYGLGRLYAENNICYACDGGAAGIYLEYTSGFSVDTITAVTNTATVTYYDDNGIYTAGGYGGALYVEVDDDSDVTIAQGRFEHNRAVCANDETAQTECDDDNAGRGGAIYWYSSSYNPSYSITNVSFYSNTAESYGGAIYFDLNDYGSIFRFEDNELKENYAGIDGGGLYADNDFGEQCIEGPYFNRNLFEGNVAGDDGGGAYLDDDFAYYCAGGEFVGNTFRLNQAGGYGGGAMIDEYVADGGAVLFSSNVFTGNVAGGDGGGLYTSGISHAADVEFVDNEMSDNVAAGDGGGLATYYSVVNEGGYLFMARNKVERNISGAAGGGIAVGDDGYALVDDGGKLDFVDNVIAGNKSEGYGAGMVIDYGLTYSGDVNFSSNIISRNIITGTEGSGGGLYAGYAFEGGTVIFNNNVITGNVATGYGGGFMFDDDPQESGGTYGALAEFRGNTLTDNVAAVDGGACYIYELNAGAHVSFLENTVHDNVAGEDGGGCYLDNIADGAEIDIGDSDFRNNQAGHNGGAVNIGSLGMTAKAGALGTPDDGSGALVHIFGNEMVGNRAGYSGTVPSGQQTGGNGGGIAIGSNGIFGGGTGSHAINIEGNLIAENHAYSGTFSIASFGDVSALAGPPANGVGGGIAIASPNTPNVTNAEFTTPASPTTQITLRDNVIRNNVADMAVAGVGVSMSLGRLTAEGNQIISNVTPGIGGGLTFESVPYLFAPLSAQANSNVEAVIVSNVITGNQAANGGSLWLYNNTITNTTEMYAYTLNNLVAQNSHGVIVQNFPYYSRNDTIAYNALRGLTIFSSITSTGSADILNSIVYNNDAEEIYKDMSTPLRINYSIIGDGGGVGYGEGNLSSDPLFVNPATSNFRLQAASPAINSAYAGPNNTYVPDVDLDGLFRPVGAGYDRGAYEWRIADVDVIATPTSPVVAPSATASFRMTVTNASNYTDDFLVRLVSNSLGWPVNFRIAATAENEYMVTVPSGGHAVFTVDVTVPVGTAGGAQTDLHFAIESQRDPYLADSIHLDVTAADMAGVALSPNNSSQAAPASIVSYAHTLTNNGNFADSIALEATSSRGWAVTVSPAPATLAAGASTTVYVTVTVPAGTGGAIDTTTVTATSSSPLGGSVATATDTTAVPQVPGVNLSPGTAKYTYPGETVTFTHQVTNTGNGPDTINFAYASVNGWAINGPATVTLPAGGSRTINVSVAVPSGFYEGADVLYVQAASAANGAVTALAQNTTIVHRPDWLPLAGVMVSPGTAKSAIPGTTIMYSHYVTNTGTHVDAFQLTYMSSNGWQVDGLANVGLAPGAGQLVNIVVTIPADAAGKKDVMSVKAVSTINPAFSMIGQDTTVVSQPGVLLSAGTASNAMPRDTVRYTHRITNTGLGADTFNISYVSEHGWSVSGPTSVPLAPGADTELIVDVTVPAGSFGINDVLTINAVSSVNPAISNFVQNTTVVATLSFELMDNNSGVLGPDGRVEYKHMLVNTGTAADIYTLQYVSSAGWNVSGPTSVSLAGGQSQLITVAIQAPDALAGGSDVTTVTAVSGLDNTLLMSVTDSTINAATRTYLPQIENHEAFIP